MRLRWMILLLAMTLTAVALGLAATGRIGAHERAITEHPVTIPETHRTIDVGSAMPAPSSSARHLSAMLEKGAMPTGRTTAVVLSDTECAPDASMISRCRNGLRLADGNRVVVRHPHDMRNVPCLAPGERVTVVPNA
jgi:hypothetical protein